jgi:hypothetical protein
MSENLMRNEIEQAQEPARRFNPNEHLVQLKSKEGAKDYLPVAWRLVWFRNMYPHGTIETEILHLDLDRVTEEEVFVWSGEKRRSEKVAKQAKGFVIFKATVTDGMGGIATGTKSEKAASFVDFLEKAESGAIGRALAALGFGTQFAPDWEESNRIVGSTVEHTSAYADEHPLNNDNGAMITAQPNTNASANGNVARANEETEACVTEQQLASIRKLCQHLGKNEPDNVAAISFLAAKQLIQKLTQEYKQSKQAEAKNTRRQNNSQPVQPSTTAAPKGGKELIGAAKTMGLRYGIIEGNSGPKGWGPFVQRVCGKFYTDEQLFQNETNARKVYDEVIRLVNEKQAI